MYWFLVAIVIRLIMVICGVSNISRQTKRRFAGIRVKKHLTGLIANNFIDTKKMYTMLSRQLPNVMLVNGIDVDKAYKMVREVFDVSIIGIYQHNQFDHDKQQVLFNMIIIVLSENRIIEIGNEYVEMLYSGDQFEWANYFAAQLSDFRLNIAAKPHTASICIAGFAGQMN